MAVVIEKGEKFLIHKTVGQKKKHYKQMSYEERKLIKDTLKKVVSIKLTSHLFKKDEFRGIREENFLEVLKDPSRVQIVEYNETPVWDGSISKRVLVRDRKATKVEFYQGHIKKVKGWANLCFVIEPTTGLIVTAYYNFATDNHHYIDWSRYSKDLKVSL